MKGSEQTLPKKLNGARKFKRNIPLHLMLIPGVIVIFIYNYIPMAGLIMAFQNYKPTKGIFRSDWVGLDNFKMFMSYPNVEQIIFNTVFIACAKLILGIIVPVIFALLLNEIRNVRYVKIVQTIVYLPNFLSWVILGSVFATVLSPSNGIVNHIIEFLGGEAKYFLGDNKLFPWTLIITDIWKNFGYGSIVYMAALMGVDSALHEAAAIDGAGKWKQTIHVTLPSIAPIIFVMAILSLGNVLNAGFDQIFNMYSPQVYQSGDILDTFIYRIGLENAKYSLSAAVGLFKSVISLILISSSYYLAKRYGDYQIF
jgi:putative aldouronate transport system permease protein